MLYWLFLLDELIRQVTISCQERGLLLLRVRDEIRMSVAAYQTLYESSVAFGMRKALQAEQGKSDMEAKVLIHSIRIFINYIDQRTWGRKKTNGATSFRAKRKVWSYWKERKWETSNGRKKTRRRNCIPQKDKRTTQGKYCIWFSDLHLCRLNWKVSCLRKKNKLLLWFLVDNDLLIVLIFLIFLIFNMKYAQNIQIELILKLLNCEMICHERIGGFDSESWFIKDLRVEMRLIKVLSNAV